MTDVQGNCPMGCGEGLILVCDDDPGIRTVVCEQLRRHGYDVTEAGSGEEVIALFVEEALADVFEDVAIRRADADGFFPQAQARAVGDPRELPREKIPRQLFVRAVEIQ